MRQRLEELKAERTYLQKRKKKAKAELAAHEHKAEIWKAVSDLIAIANTMTQTEVKGILEEAITSAVQTVYDDEDLTFNLDLNISRKRLTATPLIVEDEYSYTPDDERGGGLLQLLGLSVRPVLWSLQEKPTRPFFMLDEPIVFVGKGELLDKAATILTSLCKNLGIQILIVTHEQQLAEIANKAYLVRKEKGRPKVIALNVGGSHAN